jgi:hypothetical protein
MITKSADVADTRSTLRRALGRAHLAPWQVMLIVSTLAGVGSGWTALVRQSNVPSPFLAALTMMLATFAGWYAWSWFTHLADVVLFGGHSDYQGVLDTFWQAYAFQGLSLLTFVEPIGWLWTWVGAYFTIVAWGVIAPRRFGMRSYQAIAAATAGMLVWLACLLVVVLVLKWQGMYLGIGAFLA